MVQTGREERQSTEDLCRAVAVPTRQQLQLSALHALTKTAFYRPDATTTASRQATAAVSVPIRRPATAPGLQASTCRRVLLNYSTHQEVEMFSMEKPQPGEALQPDDHRYSK